MAKKNKYYVVWVGKTPGVYTSWADCEKQTKGVEGAKFKSFEDSATAQAAFKGNMWNYLKSANTTPTSNISKTRSSRGDIIWESISVDAACSGNPGDMEYRGVETKSGKELFRMGPFAQGTNNIGEFLALVHGIAFLQKNGYPQLPIYTDSKNGMIWLKGKICKTKLERTNRNQKVFELIERAEAWLKVNTFQNPIYKWETKDWGEIPADFGRK
jgi:ribonuclease HI